LYRSALSGVRYTFPSGINDWEEITGTFNDAKGGHGFVFDISGNLTIFDGPNAPNTGGVGITASGEVAGVYSEPRSGIEIGFIRDRFGNLTSFSPPGAEGT
jgi:hypothetical protein